MPDRSPPAAARPGLAVETRALTKRFGPFAGGNQGPILNGNEEQTQVEVPKEDNLIIRGLGKEDPRLYANKAGSRARRELDGTEYSKPEADVSKDAQPIPPEYRDLLP